MSGPFTTTARLPRSGNSALAAGALVQVVVGAEFVFAGLSKAVDADFAAHFRAFLKASPGATSGPLSSVAQALLVPNAELVALLAKWTELGAGVILLVTALEVLRRRLSAPLGAQHAYEPLLALLTSASAFALAAMSLGIFVLEGARLPTVNPGFAFTSPIAVELLLVPLALGIAWLELGRFRALR